jgi:chemotaxis protein MotB
MKDQEKKPRRRVKKVKGHGGHHGGSWKVAYADLVTALMALFLVLWLVSQGDQKLKEAIANYFRSPGVFDTMRGGVISGPTKVSKEPSSLTSKDDEQALFSTAALLRKKFASRPEFANYKDQIKIEMTDEGLRIQIVDKAERVSFNSGSAQMTGEAAAILKEIAQAICGLPNAITIGGHTDRLTFPAGSPYTNWELSADRANAARRVLEANCVRPDHINRIVGHADTQLLYPDNPAAPGNRRISIVVLRLKGGEAGRGGPGEDGGASKPAADGEAKPDSEVKPGGETNPAGAPASNAAAPPSPAAPATPGAKDDQPGGKESAAEARAAGAKLASEGSVSVGAPDKVPAGVTRHREAAPKRAGAVQ